MSFGIVLAISSNVSSDIATIAKPVVNSKICPQSLQTVKSPSLGPPESKKFVHRLSNTLQDGHLDSGCVNVNNALLLI